MDVLPFFFSHFMCFHLTLFLPLPLILNYQSTLFSLWKWILQPIIDLTCLLFNFIIFWWVLNPNNLDKICFPREVICGKGKIPANQVFQQLESTRNLNVLLLQVVCGAIVAWCTCPCHIYMGGGMLEGLMALFYHSEESSMRNLTIRLTGIWPEINVRRYDMISCYFINW